MGTKLKILDYNIRCANDGINPVTGSNNDIAARAPRLEAVIRKYDPDVIGLQEASRKWIEELSARLMDTYCMTYLYRNENSMEATPVLWKRDKLAVKREGHFWLSETPEVSSKGWGAKHYRICNWLRFKVRETGEQFIFANTHLQGGEIAARSAELILDWLGERGAFTEYGAFLTGDFNVPPESDCCKILNESGKLKDINVDLGFDPSYTNNGYNSRPDDHYYNSIKDFIFYTPSMMKPLTYKVLNENHFDGWVSDHRGLYAEVELKD